MIGLLDSGMGGLAVVDALVKRHADSRYCLIADTAHAPYGNRVQLDIIHLVDQLVGQLRTMGADRIVLACNTATMAALDYLHAKYDFAVYGITPPIESAAQEGDTLVLATAYTAAHLPDVPSHVTVLSMPQLATLIDAHYPYDLRPIEAYLRQKLAAYRGIPNLVLGCTHYRLVAPLLRQIVAPAKLWDGTDVLVRQFAPIAPAHGCAIDVIAGDGADFDRYAATLKKLLAAQNDNASPPPYSLDLDPDC